MQTFASHTAMNNKGLQKQQAQVSPKKDKNIQTTIWTCIWMLIQLVSYKYETRSLYPVLGHQGVSLIIEAE